MILDTGLLDTNVLGDSTSLIVDVSNVVNSVRTSRGRNVQSNQFQTGTLTLVIVDQNGDFNPQYAAGPYFSYLTPMKKVQITATYSGVTYPVFSGFITSYSTSIPDASTGSVALTTITAVDAFRLAQNAQISTVAGSGVQLSGARINALLDAISWPNSMRTVADGLTTCQADSGLARASLTALQLVEATEFGAFYVDASGSFIFKDRTSTATSVAGTPTVFSDIPGVGIDYFNVVWVLNDLLIFNSAQITAAGLAVQSATDSASVTKYFTHSYNQQGLLMQTTAEALQWAQMFVASNAETTIRVDEIVLDLYTADYNAGIIAALSLDYFNPVTITTSQPGSTVLSKTLQVFGKSMDITPNSWKVRLETLEAIIDSFILDSSLYGLLDTDVLSY
jgi:hypothetical protein